MIRLREARIRKGIDFILDPMWAKVSDDLQEHIDGLRSSTPRPAPHRLHSGAPSGASPVAVKSEDQPQTVIAYEESVSCQISQSLFSSEIQGSDKK